MDIYDCICFKDYEVTLHGDWRYPKLYAKQLTQIDRYMIPGFIEFNSLVKGYNEFTNYCDKYLTEQGLLIKNSLGWVGQYFGTYLYMGGILLDRTDKRTGEAIFRMYGYTAGAISVVDGKIKAIHFNDIAIFGSDKGIAPVYRKEILDNLSMWVGKPYNVNAFEVPTDKNGYTLKYIT